ncbi:hypothetical protein ABE237_21485 [Brevibacillus formosus]|uniref:hypothetical protein n=1 Tax=Brevibacillus formosus TaxID=54913 RepID=UPI0018CCEBB7|nr:hypothetical protein [Brevibacillus formosus]MBG9941029.1 hypothetical protein [Brevibacillus formosus]
MKITEKSIENQIKELINEIAQGSEWISELDSFEFIQLILKLELSYNITFDEQMLIDNQTIMLNELSQYVYEKVCESNGSCETKN